MADKFLSFVDKLFWAEKKDVYLNDFIDKCHHTISSSMFTFFALFIGSWIVAGQPINCFVPPEFPGYEILIYLTAINNHTIMLVSVHKYFFACLGRGVT